MSRPNGIATGARYLAPVRTPFILRQDSVPGIIQNCGGRITGPRLAARPIRLALRKQPDLYVQPPARLWPLAHSAAQALLCGRWRKEPAPADSKFPPC